MMRASLLLLLFACGPSSPASPDAGCFANDYATCESAIASGAACDFGRPDAGDFATADAGNWQACCTKLASLECAE